VKSGTENASCTVVEAAEKPEGAIAPQASTPASGVTGSGNDMVQGLLQDLETGLDNGTLGDDVETIGQRALALVRAALAFFDVGKEKQRQAYLDKAAEAAKSGNADARKFIEDWAKGVSATEAYDGSTRGNEPDKSRAYAQQILDTLPPPAAA
jgi:hypothetical protein